MRKNLIKVALFSYAFMSITSGGAQALSMTDLTLTDDPFSSKNRLAAMQQATKTPTPKEEGKPEEVPAPAPIEKTVVQHTVAESETLTAISQKHGVAWRRVFDKNTQIANPDVLNIGEVLTIPEAEEQLAERPLPAAVPMATAAPLNGAAAATGPYPRGSSAGNTYAPGYCTWYAKNRRPDLPNRMGNAISWVASAAAQGYATGSVPRAGSIGQQGNHVVYVESVNGDGSVTVSEMNYQGLFIVSSRTVAASSFQYIY